MRTRPYRPGLHNLTLAMVNSEIKRLEGEIRHPMSDPEVVERQRMSLSLLRDELAKRTLRK